MSGDGLLRRLISALILILLVPSVAATFPYPSPPAGVDPSDFAAYTYLGPGVPLPSDYAGGDVWKYSGDPSGDPVLDRDPAELYGVTGMGVDRAWRITTGRPDVVIAVLDSGIFWDERDVAHKVYLNVGEIPDAADVDGNAVVNVLDFPSTPDRNGNGFVDGQDLIRRYSDGVDDDGNGYVDDIAGWNTLDGNNDPADEVRYGHGTGEAKDSAGEADNGADIPGTCPNCMMLPIRVGMSFIASDNDFGEGVLFALASGADVVQEALGTVDNTPLAGQALRQAWEEGVPVIASAADEASYHHNYPAAHEYTINVNSVTRASELFPGTGSYLFLNGCTNFGANVAVSVSSTSCSSEATGRGAGIAGLIVSAARDAGKDLSANEVRQLMTTTADDVDMSQRPRAVAAPIPTLRYPSLPGYDTYFGYGRLDAEAAVRAAREGRIPPEAEIVTPGWWEPLRTVGQVAVTGLASAARSSSYGYTLEVGCGLHPTEWVPLASAADLTGPTTQLGTLDLADADAFCLLRRAPQLEAPLEPNEHGLTLRLRVTDAEGRMGEHRKYIFAAPGDELRAFVGASGEQSPRFADITGDGRPELVVSTAEGVVNAFLPDMTQPPGWPLRTAGHDSILHGGIAIADLDGPGGDGRPEIVAGTYQGHVYVWESDGTLRMRLQSTHRFSEPEMRDPHNRVYRGFVAAPVLADLDGDGDREIVQAGMDRHLYVWDARGEPLPGFPTLVVDRAMVRVVDPQTHKLAPIDPRVVGQGAEIVSTPAVADLDGDGTLEIVLGHNEEYVETPDASPLTSAASTVVKQSGLFKVGNGRLHAIRLDGSEMPGFPVKVPDLALEVLPTVGDGVPGSPTIADIDGDGSPEIGIFATVGPMMLFRADGTPYYGRDPNGLALTMRTDVPGADPPVLPALGSAVLADVTGTGAWRAFAPALGLQRALDVGLPGEQVGARDLVMSWDAATGLPAPGWPSVIEDMMFLTSPAVVDIDGDGRVEVLMGSGGYYLHAFDALTGVEKAGWPKFTGGWIIATPAVGDWDGDGANEVAVTTREGWLFVWEAGGSTGGRAPWPTIHHDLANTGNAMLSQEQGVGRSQESRGSAVVLGAAPLLALVVLLRRR